MLVTVLPGGAISSTTACATTITARACERSPTSARTTARSVSPEEKALAASSAVVLSTTLSRTGALVAFSRLAIACISFGASPSSEPAATVNVVGCVE